MTEALDAIENAVSEETNQYINRIFFAEHKGVVCICRPRNELQASSEVVSFSQASDLWFYSYIEARLKSMLSPAPDTIDLSEYLFHRLCKSDRHAAV